MGYIYQRPDWPTFTWEYQELTNLLAEVRHKQGKLVGRMEALGFSLQEEAVLRTMTLEVVKSSEIEGEILDPDQVRSSLAQRLGIHIGGLIPADRHVEGVVEMLLDATQKFTNALTTERLLGWQAALFPGGYSGTYQVLVGKWRDDSTGPIQVVSGPLGRERVHFQAPAAEQIPAEMERFINWFNTDHDLDPVIKAAIAHLWFVTIHPFEDGNGRIARTLTDMQLARSDGSPQRFYSMSAQIRLERRAYYAILEKTQRGDLDITDWLNWFLNCLNQALSATEEVLVAVINKSRYWTLWTEKKINSRQRLLLNKLLDGFQGKLTTSKWAKIARCSQDTALRDIQDLVEQEVLVKEDSGGRSTSYCLVGLE
jgi:Fic family protein